MEQGLNLFAIGVRAPHETATRLNFPRGITALFYATSCNFIKVNSYFKPFVTIRNSIWHALCTVSGVSVTGCHSFARVKKSIGRVNAGRRLIKRLGRSHQEQRNRRDNSPERCIGSRVELIYFRLIPLGKPLLKSEPKAHF